MYQPTLFLGCAIDNLFHEELKCANSYLVTLMIGKPEYLSEIEYKGSRYLGKYVSHQPTIDQLDDLEKHLLSLLHKLTPNHSFTNTPPVLVIT